MPFTEPKNALQKKQDYNSKTETCPTQSPSPLRSLTQGQFLASFRFQRSIRSTEGHSKTASQFGVFSTWILGFYIFPLAMGHSGRFLFEDIFPAVLCPASRCLLPAQKPQSIHGRNAWFAHEKKIKNQTTSIWREEPFCVPSPYFHFGSLGHKCLVMLSNNNIIWELCPAEWDHS